MSDEGRPAAGDYVAQGAGARRVPCRNVQLTDEERERRRADVRRRADRQREELTQRGMQSLAGQVQSNTDEIAVIKAGLAAAFEFAGKDAPEGLALPPRRPELKLIQGGAGAA